MRPVRVIVRKWLHAKNVKRSAAKMSIVQQSEQVRIDDRRAPSNVDHVRSCGQLRQPRAVEEVLCVACQRQRVDEKVRSSKENIELLESGERLHARERAWCARPHPHWITEHRS